MAIGAWVGGLPKYGLEMLAAARELFLVRRSIRRAASRGLQVGRYSRGFLGRRWIAVSHGVEVVVMGQEGNSEWLVGLGWSEVAELECLVDDVDCLVSAGFFKACRHAADGIGIDMHIDR